MGYDTDEERIIYLLLSRLERIPPDSHWAHRASGIRRALLAICRTQESTETTDTVPLESLINRGFNILEKAAKEKFH